MSPVFAATCPTGMVAVEYDTFVPATAGACPTGYVEHEVTSLCDSDSTGTCWVPDAETISCDPGYFFDADTQGCLRCTGGYYCPGGTYVVGDADAGKTICPTGTYADTGASECTKCPAGTYSDTKGKSACTTCPAGTYSTATGATSESVCTACPAGTSSSVTGAAAESTCVACSSGTYATGGATQCTKCVATPCDSLSGGVLGAGAENEYGLGPDSNCDYYHGTYTGYDFDAQTWWTTCDDIKISGDYVCSSTAAATGVISKDTPTVDTSDNAGNLNGHCWCKMTAPFVGQYWVSTGYNTTDEAAMWGVDYAQTICMGYGAGPSSSCAWRCSRLWNQTVDDYNQEYHYYGYYTDDGLVKYKTSLFMPVVSCSPGQYLNSDTNSCETCPAGTYSDTENASQCTVCPAGTYSAIVGATSESVCTACPAGTYCSDVGMATPLDCPAGTYSTATGATSESVCTACPVGKYSEIVGASSVFTCLACPAGTYSYITGATECESCPAGTYSTAAGATSASTCELCPAGTYSATVGATSESVCTACPVGMYAPSAGTTSCLVCSTIVCDPITGEETVDAAVVKCARIPTNIARWYITSGGYDDTGWSFEYNGYAVSGTAELESDDGMEYTVKCNITSPFVGTATCIVPKNAYNVANSSCANPGMECDMYEVSNISTSERDVCPDGFFSISYEGADDIPNCADDTSGEYCLVTLVKPCELGISALKTSSGLSFALYAEKYTTPAINIGYNGGMCYANLEPGQSAGAINVSYNGQIYHTAK